MVKETMEQVIIEDNKDWDGRPYNVCQGCGYHTCCCPLQKPEDKNRSFNYQELLIQIRKT